MPYWIFGWVVLSWVLGVAAGVAVGGLLADQTLLAGIPWVR